jgi:hypothetical protein
MDGRKKWRMKDDRRAEIEKERKRGKYKGRKEDRIK